MNDNPIIQQLFTKLNQSQVRYAVLRNYLTLPNSLGGSDLDIWINQKDSNVFEAILKETIEIQGAQLVSFIDSENCRKLCYLNLITGVQMDIFIGDIMYNSGILIQENVINDNIMKYNGINVLHPSLGNIVALLKELLNNGCCTTKYVSPIYENKHIYNRTYLSGVLKTFDNRFIDALLYSIREDKLQESGALLRKKTGYGKGRVVHLIRKIGQLRRLSNPPGYVVAVLGTDGSGKSTIINAIIPWLAEPFHNGVFYRHLRPSLFPDLGCLLGKRSKNHKQSVVSNPHSGRTAGFLESLIRLIYYSLDYTLGFFKVVTLKKFIKSSVFIFDRFYYDYYIDQKRSGIKLPRWIIRFFELFIPSPDLILCLGGDPFAIYNRKPETSLAEVQRQNDELRRFCNSRKNAFWIDTTLSKEESVYAVKLALMQMMSKRFRF